MTSEDLNVFVICPANAIERGGAKPFSLSRVNEDGEGRPFPIVVIRTDRDDYFAYVNQCPHNRVWLNIGDGGFFSEDRSTLECGRHQAKFDIESGLCIEGPCEGDHLKPIALAVIDGDVCLCGLDLVEDDGMPNPFEDPDDTMENMIHPD